MKAFAITHPGTEDIAAVEVQELTDSAAELREAAVLFEIKKPEELCSFCYYAQSIIKAGLLFTEFNASPGLEETFSKIKPALEDSHLLEWLKRGRSFKSECRREGEHNFSSVDLSSRIAAFISKTTGLPSDFKNPDIILFAYVRKDRGYFGVDFSGIDLSKRDYKVFAHPASLKGTIAYSLLRISGYKKNETILDPFAKSGVIPIEAAMFSSGTSVNKYRLDLLAFSKLVGFIPKEKAAKAGAKIIGADSQIRNLKAAEKNAKIAGVKKLIAFSRIDIEWLDTKFKKGEIDKIVTCPPSVSKRADPKEMEKLYNEFFYQSEYILSKTGKMALLTKSPDQIKAAAQKHKFALESERVVWSGKEALQALVFKK